MHIQLEVLSPYAYHQPIPLPLSYQEILIIENINLSRKRKKIVSKLKCKKKTNSKKGIHPQSSSFERRICAQTQDLQIFKKFNPFKPFSD